MAEQRAVGLSAMMGAGSGGRLTGRLAAGCWAATVSADPRGIRRTVAAQVGDAAAAAGRGRGGRKWRPPGQRAGAWALVPPAVVETGVDSAPRPATCYSYKLRRYGTVPVRQ